MNLRSRVIAGAEEQDEEEEVLIEQEEEGEEMATEKKGVAGDERNIAVLLFLYVLQVNNPAWCFKSLVPGHLPPLNSRTIPSYAIMTNSCSRASLLDWLLLSPLFSPTKMLVPIIIFRHIIPIIIFRHM